MATNKHRNIIRIGQKLTIYVSKEKTKQLGIKQIHTR